MESVTFATALSDDAQGRTIPDYDHRVPDRLYRGSDRQERRERSRSRSRSPAQAQLDEDEGDRKLPAKSIKVAYPVFTLKTRFWVATD